MQELSSEYYKNLLENIDIGVYFVDNNRRITFFNKAAEKITGYSASEVIGASCKHNLFKHIDQNGVRLCIEGCPLHATINDGTSRHADVFLHHKEGHRVPIRVNSSQIIDDNGNVIGAVETFFDTSAEAKIEQENEDLKVLAMVDELTGLPNRRYLEEWLIAKNREYKTFGRKYGVIIIDIDNFKNVNDTYGHLVGDDVLKVVSKTLKGATRANDISARYGGEEFMMVISGINEEKLHHIGKRTCALIFNSTLEVGQVDLSVSVSMGAALIEEDDDIKSLVARADQYLYKAKANGKSRICSSSGEDAVGIELNAGKRRG